MKGLVIRPGAHVFEIKDFAEPLNQTLKEAIGGWIELIHPRGLRPPLVMIGDEEALLKENPQLNVVGSVLYGTLEHGHPICGTIVIMAEGFNSDGDLCITGLSNDQIQQLLARFGWDAFETEGGE